MEKCGGGRRNSKREVAEKGKGWMDGVVERSKAGMEGMRKKENSTEGQQKKKEALFFLFVDPH